MTFIPHRKTMWRAFSVAAALSAAAFVPSCLQSAYTADPETNPLSPVSFTYHAKDGTLIELTALTDNSVRVRSTKNKTFSNKPEFILTGAKPRAFTKVRQNADGFTCTIDDLSVRYQGSTLSFSDAKHPSSNRQENVGARKFGKSPSRDAAADSYCVESTFVSPGAEFQFGLGQFQDSVLNIKNQPRQLIQVNTQASVPFLYSTAGYGLLWHNYSRTEFNPADTPIELKKVAEGQGQTGGCGRPLRIRT